MCGFTGFVSARRISSHPYDPHAVIHAMASSIAHRGPDSEGHFVDEACALGFRRLAIIDLERGSQPMESADGSLVLCFNGEVYNHCELRSELAAAGHVFRTRSDTEVLLHGFEQWGANLVDRLRGMFSFVVYDRRARRLFIARDPFGIKPLYYCQAGDTLLFASEAKAFLHHPLFEKRLDETLLPLYLCFEYIPDDKTLFEGVRRFPAGHCAWWQDGKMELTRYFRPRYRIDESLTLDAWAERIGNAVAESCRAHAIADVDVGCFLSAGVDSSFVAAEASRIMSAKTFSIGYAEKRYSELEKARALARNIGVFNASRTITAADFFNAAPAVQFHMDEPLPNPSAIPLFYLSRFAANEVKVVMSGEGADELFGGYAYYQECLDYEPYMKVPQPVRTALGNLASMMPSFHGRRFLMRGRYPLPKRYIRNNYVFRFEDCDRMLREPVSCPNPASCVAETFAEAAGLDEVTQMQYADMAIWMQYDVLQKADKMSMAASLELRVPFLDRNVLDVALQIPSRYRVSRNQTKIALREASRAKLPQRTSEMPKIGFITPLNDWLKQKPFQARIREAFNGEEARRFFDVGALNRLVDDHAAGRARNMKKIWSIYSFLLWYDEYFVKR